MRYAGVGARLSLAPSPVPRFVVCCARFPGSRHLVAVVAWHLSLCRGPGGRRASLACLVAPRWCAAPRPVRSLPVPQSAFPSPWCLPPPRGLPPPALLGGCAGHVEAGREPGSLCLPLAPAEARARGALRVVPVWGPAMGVSLAGPFGFGLGLRALRWVACVDPVTDASGFPYRPSFDGGLGRCTGAVSRGRRHLSFRVGGRHTRVARVCVCVLFLAGSGGPASWAHFGALHLFLWPLLVRSLFARPPPGLGCPVCGCCWLFSSFVFFFFSLAVSGVPCFPGRGALGPGVLWSSAPHLFFFVPGPLVSCVRCFPARGAVGLGALLSSRVAPLFACFFSSSSPPPPSPFSFFLFFPFLFRLLPFCALFFFFLFFSLPCRAGCAVAGLVRVSLAAGCAGVCCCVVGCSLVVPGLCVLLSVGCGGVFCIVRGAVWAAWVGLGSCSALLPPVAVSWSPVVARDGVLSWGAALRCSDVPPLVRCAAVVPCCLVRAGWCCVVLPAVAGCSLLGMVACRCFPLACVVRGAPASPRGLLPCCVLSLVVVPRPPVLCPVFCGALLPCGAVLWRPAVRFPFLVVLFCVFSLCVRCCVALRVVLFGAGLVCAVVGASRCGMSLCVVSSPWAFCGAMVLL